MVASVALHLSCFSSLVSEVDVDDVVVEQRLQRRCKQQLRKLAADNRPCFQPKSRHNLMCCTSLFARKLMSAHERWNRGRRRSRIAKNTIVTDAFSK